MRCIERTPINQSKAKNVRLKRLSRLSMSGQTEFPTDAASSRHDDNDPLPPRSESPKEQFKSKYAVAKNDAGGDSSAISFPSQHLGEPSGEKMAENAKERRNKSSAAPDQASPLRQEASSHDRQGAKVSDNTRRPHPHNAKGNVIDKYDQPVTKLSQPRATSKYGLSGAAGAPEIPSKMASDAKMPADGTSPISDQFFTDGWSRKTPSSPSSPSKKKKNKKKKKKGKSLHLDDPLCPETKILEAPDQIQKINSVINSVPQVAADVEYPEVEPASVNVENGLDPSESSTAPASTRSMITPSKNTEAAGEFVHLDEMNEKNNGIKSSRHAENPEKIITFVKSKESFDEIKNTDSRDNMESGPSTELSSPNKTEISAQDNHSSDPDDGVWETVEVKPRGRRRKGGSKKSSTGTQNNGTASNSSTSNNSNGRNQSNNDNASAHHDGGSSHNGRRRHAKRCRDKNRNNSEQQQQQQNKMIKDVILQILDAVDDEVVRIGIDGAKQLDNASTVGDKVRNNPNVKNVNHSSSAFNSKLAAQQQHTSEGLCRNHSNGVAASSKTLSTPSLASNLSAKSLRDVLVGISPSTAANVAPEIKNSSLQPSANNRALCKAKEEGIYPPSSNGSSKVKPGMSYKSVIEPLTTVDPKQSCPPKPKLNAWAKPPSEIKAKLNVESKTKAEVVLAAVKPLSEQPTQSSGLIALDGNTPSSECGLKKESNISVTADTGKVQQRTSASLTDDDGAPPPLTTLIGPGNSCSASSSVASSLEAPHSSSNRFRHQSTSATTEDDVGYHLLNVCGRLSEEITTFMSRRALALDIRRKERDAVLGALGDTLAKIWPGQCRVEMYGSCATQLDLPSSDLDLVVCGLDDVIPDQFIEAPSLHSTPLNSFHEQEDTAQESVFMSHGNNHGRLSPRSPTFDRHIVQTTENAAECSFHVVGGGEQTSLDLAVLSVESGEQTSMVHDINPENGMIMDTEYSSGDVKAENHSHEYYEPNQQTEVSAFSPAFSYHSQVSSGYDGETTSGIEGYAHDYPSNGEEFYYASSYSYVSSLSMNAQRVLRLASELELQPWAVQVKAIPTATVPVVKMLADPSKLPGLAGTGGGWILHQHIAVQAEIAAAGTPPTPNSPERGSGTPQSHFFSSHQMTPQWRGADIMNGLQPVDITFEGPEHGGIGSTTYSTRVVQEACEELSLAPESTPVVQVASVLKELLAQRRLNEPFSGGLSSYGLLLLLVAILKDRKIIQEEMQKFGKANASSTDSLITTDVAATGQSEASPGTNSSDKSYAAPSTASKPTVSSSWASIAKKSNGSTAKTESSTVTKSTNDSAIATALVAKSTCGTNASVFKSKVATHKKGDDKEYDTSLTNKELITNLQKKVDSNGLRSIVALAEKKQNLSCLDGKSAVTSQVTPSSETPSSEDATSTVLPSSSVPQGSNDIFEVLCSGELTSGKLLMHFLLFYGHHFDARSTMIDINGTHHPEYGMIDLDRISPFVPRPPGGTIDPITGMFSVDPIVVYDPLEGAIDHNVTKRCYCWNNVKWVFAQCYMTVSTIVEMSDTTCGKTSPLESKKYKRDAANDIAPGSGKPKEEQEPILEHFLSF
ncbi:hypothetical protein ACHAXA_009422 [Cyclostephanos tholiformis]|uniref:Uncharacterized protein n=1 Tax=Cyclostephanos tholiformis TaxID=382380 RepID=A0ABD3R8M1_9STRA